MTVYQWLCVLGVPTAIIGLIGYLIKKIRDTAKETKAIALGIQALLRAQMRREYDRCSKQGYAMMGERDDFENCWVQYHALGANGVMDDIHSKFLALPIGGGEE